VPLVREIQAHGELVDAGFAQGEVLFFRHLGPVRDQDGIGDSAAVLDRTDDLDNIGTHERLAARNLHHARLERFRVAAVVGRFQIAGLVTRTAVVAVLAVAGAGIGDLEGDDDRPLDDPVHGPASYDLEGVGQGDFAHTSTPFPKWSLRPY
jgi:hypothetical protein